MGWPAGTSIDSQDTLSFSVMSGVRPMTEVYPLERAGEAYEQMMKSGRARFRAVLKQGIDLKKNRGIVLRSHDLILSRAN